MGNRRDVRDAGDLQSAIVQRAHSRLATGARAPDTHFDVLHAVLLRRIASLFSRNLRGERRALAGAAEATTARSCPGKRVPLAIGDRDDRIVEGRVDVRDRVQHVLTRLLRLLGVFAARRRTLLLLISHA